MKKIISIAIITALCSLFSFAAAAGGLVAQHNNTITLMGVDGSDGHIFAGVTGSTEGYCTAFRFYSARSDTDKILSILTAAKLAGKRVRVDLADSSDCNTAFRAYIQ